MLSIYNNIQKMIYKKRQFQHNNFLSQNVFTTNIQYINNNKLTTNPTFFLLGVYNNSQLHARNIFTTNQHSYLQH
jgi:hypothetical protein